MRKSRRILVSVAVFVVASLVANMAYAAGWYPYRCILYQFPGQSDQDWRIDFDIRTNTPLDQSKLRIYFFNHLTQGWNDWTYMGYERDCIARLYNVSSLGNGRYLVTYIAGRGRVNWCLGYYRPWPLESRPLETWGVYLYHP